MLRMLVLFILIAPLAGCLGTQERGSVAGGECGGVFEPAQYQILGKTRFDQDKIDQWIESGIAACGWPRPQTRPESWDQVQDYVRQVAATPPAPKKGVIKRVKERIFRRPVAAPVPVPRPAEAPIAPVQYLPPSPLTTTPTPKPRDPVDELLDPEPAPRVILRR